LRIQLDDLETGAVEAIRKTADASASSGSVTKQASPPLPTGTALMIRNSPTTSEYRRKNVPSTEPDASWYFLTEVRIETIGRKSYR
jgi:hypothetical protein